MYSCKVYDINRTLPNTRKTLSVKLTIRSNVFFQEKNYVSNKRNLIFFMWTLIKKKLHLMGKKNASWFCFYYFLFRNQLDISS